MSGLIGSLGRYLVLAFALFGLIGQAHAVSTPEIAKGLAWLQTQVNADGSLAGESVSIATPLQARAEALATFKLLSTVPSALSGAISAETEDNTEYLARRAIALSLAGQNADTLIAMITARQNSDGGFGGALNHDSNPLDTAWALLALMQSGQGGTNPAIGARLYVSAAILVDGGVDGESNAERIEVGALALLALQANQSDLATANIVKNLTAWLLQLQGTDGSWEGDTYLTAFVLFAISPVTADASIHRAAQTFLVSQQVADGSWNGDPFLTALVLRTLSRQPAFTPTGSTLQGQVVDSSTRTPLLGVTVTLSDTANQIVTTDATGHFSFNGLVEGNYALTYTLNGYLPITLPYTVSSMQAVNAGIVGLAQATGIIRGQIRAAETGLPLSGVAVSVSGAVIRNTATDSNGMFEIGGVPTGAITISATLPGYQAVSATGTSVAGQVVMFSSTLYSNGQTLPTIIPFTGKVISAAQVLPLGNVVVKIYGSAGNSSTVTNAAGQFDLTLSPGSNTVTYTLAGYITIVQTFIVTAGTTVDAGNIALTSNMYTITGRVFNTSNQLIAGALVQVFVGTNVISTTATDGNYAIVLAGVQNDGLIVGNAVRASAVGFNSQTVNIQYYDPAIVQQDFVLTAQTAGAASIGALTSDQFRYGAYVPVAFQIQVQNSGTQAVTGSVFVSIVGADGQAIDNPQATWFDANGVEQRMFTFATGITNITVPWNTSDNSPGAYNVIARMYQRSLESSGGTVETVDKQTNITIDASQAIGSMTLTPLPRFTGVGATETISFNLEIVNRSNVPISTDVAFQLKTPSGVVVYSATSTVPLSPVEKIKSIVFPGTSYRFVESGSHPTAVQTANGPVPVSVTGNAIAVAPGMRIDPSQQITPSMVTPDGDKRIRVHIRLKGVELK